MKNISFLGALLLCSLVYAQDGLPPEASHGKCYAKCVLPDEYSDSTIRLMVKPAYKQIKVIPAEYKTVTDTVVLKPASKRYVNVPAKFKTVTDTVITEEPYNVLTVVPASFKNEVERVQVKPAIGKWEMGGPVPDCKSVDPNDCRLVWYKEYPPLYKNVPTQTLNQDVSTQKKPTKPKYKTIRRQVVVEPARVDEIPIPAEYTTVQKRVLVKDETVEEETVPAEYTEVVKKILVKKGGMTVWREVECELVEGIVLPIYYSVGSAVLSSQAKKIIDEKLYSKLKAEPLIHVEIGSHTDSRGNDASNQSLSQKRAQSVVNYLVGKGIAKERLRAKGYGETKLVNQCGNGVTCTDDEHRQNRRTEFRIVNY